tara:strand:+ start:273 stop:584 length:312 start_codon:yes stop_codon:yes gene_type:complete
MAKKKTQKKTEEVATLAPGFGLDTTLRTTQTGHKFMECHWVAVGSHPVNGLRIVGPFKSRDGCKAWINSDACQYMSMEIADRASDYTWTAGHLDVMTTDSSYQ